MKDLFVAYYRVSTSSQGINGLGIDAQRAAVKKFLNGDTAKHEFVEVESGKRNQRPELDRAIACCRATKAKLIIAKLDRLSRNASFLLNLMESHVDFVCCDMPNADKFTIQILACVAQKEAEMISQRTKEGLQAAKRRGVKLGNPKIAKIQPKAIAAKKEHARAFAAKLKPIIEKAQRHGVTTLQELADALNARGYKTPTGKEFFPQSVSNLLARLNF
jgi:DNA invertase Pin-like site-specific DNA recombinase